MAKNIEKKILAQVSLNPFLGLIPGAQNMYIRHIFDAFLKFHIALELLYLKKSSNMANKKIFTQVAINSLLYGNSETLGSDARIRHCLVFARRQENKFFWTQIIKNNYNVVEGTTYFF